MALDNEHEKVKSELENMQKMFQQLTEEKSEESYDIRRAYMLKSQVVQLERQCMLLSEALSSRTATVQQIENELTDLTGEFRELLAHQTSGPTVPIARKILISHIQRMQKLKGSLAKQSVANNVDNLSIPQLSGWKFAKMTPVSCLDVCDGSLKHLNLQYVAKLESNLSKLYKQLVSYQTLLKANLPVDEKQPSPDFPEKYFYSQTFKHIKQKTETCIKELDGCCSDLLSVSLLHPSAPWAVIQKPEKYGKFNPQLILQTLPSPIHRKNEVKSVIVSLCKVHSYFMHLNKLKLKVMHEQLEHCRKQQQIQNHYMNCLLTGVTGAYAECETGLKKRICDPLQEVVEKWFEMKESQCDETLRQFLAAFKRNENEFRDFTTLESSSLGVKVLDEFGAELKQTIHGQQVKCAQECENLTEEISKFKDENEVEVDKEMKQLTMNGS